MFDHVRTLYEGFGAELTLKGPLACVDLDMVLEVVDGVEQLATAVVTTLKNGKLLVAVLVHHHVGFEFAVWHVPHGLASLHVLGHADLVGVFVLHDFDKFNLPFLGFPVQLQGAHLFFVKTLFDMFLLVDCLGDGGQCGQNLLGKTAFAQVFVH